MNYRLYTEIITYFETTSWVEGKRGDQIRNRPKQVVEREFIYEFIRKDSFGDSSCKSSETTGTSGSLRILLTFIELASSLSAADFPASTKIQVDSDSIAETKHQE